MNLGKNPHATCAIKLLADRMEQQNLPAWILYQMHDFAEEHRPACWQALKNCTGHPDAAFAVEIMYPTSGRIVWACLNSADRNKLLSIGIPPEKVHVLPNTIDTELFTAPPLASITEEQLQELHVQPAKFNTQLKHRIEDFAKQNGFTFSPAYKILLAPIKAIRRKNLAESILLMMSMNHRKDPWQLLVTLPANTEEDLEYCREMETFVKENELPVVIGFGAEIISGHARQIAGGEIEKFSLIDLMAISKAIVTTSIQEGFGYVFHEGWLTGKAVLGRNIGHLTCDFVTAGMRLEHLYDHLLFPMEWLGPLVKSVKTAWYQKLDALWENTDFDRLSASKLQNMLKNQKIFTNKHGPMLDFADLDLAAQLHIIKKVIESPPLISHLVWTDKEGKTLPGWYPSEISGIIEHNREVVSMKYNLAANARKFLSLVDVGKRTLLTSEEHRLARYTSNESIFAVTLEAKHVRLLI
jgi:glycosyltransferase involved in cell wall biosynthesis